MATRDISSIQIQAYDRWLWDMEAHCPEWLEDAHLVSSGGEVGSNLVIHLVDMTIFIGITIHVWLVRGQCDGHVFCE